MVGHLKRSVGLAGLIFYGVGTMVGGGIYALLGKVAAESLILTPWAMLLAGGMALFSALSFAELATRFPQSSGPAYYISQAFNNEKLGSFFGWLVIATGVVSSATLTIAVSGFILDLAAIPQWISQVFIVVFLGALACWGIKQSVVVIAAVTVIEVLGLVVVVVINLDSLTIPNDDLWQLVPKANGEVWTGIFAGAFLAFYAFIGFEDLVTLAEEVKGGIKKLAFGIVISLAITLILYISVSLIAALSVDLDAFAHSHTPMALLVKDTLFISPVVLILISLLAGVNGALVQVIMAARVLYGMGSTNQAPSVFSRVNSTTQTPIIATLAIGLVIVLLTYLGNITSLAKLTSGIILVVFAGVNLSLCKVKLSGNQTNDTISNTFSVPLFVPLLGCIVSSLGLVFAVWQNLDLGH